MRAAFNQVVEDEVGAAALQQALRDKNAETHMVRIAGSGGEIRFAEAAKQMRRETGAVIDDLDRNRGLVPMRRYADLVAGELHRVLDQVVKAVHDFRAAADLRL